MTKLALSQKQKVVVLLSILLFGFAALAIFTAERLSHMKEQYQSSASIAQGSLSIYQTQSIILALSAELDTMTG